MAMAAPELDARSGPDQLEQLRFLHEVARLATTARTWDELLETVVHFREHTFEQGTSHPVRCSRLEYAGDCLGELPGIEEAACRLQRDNFPKLARRMLEAIGRKRGAVLAKGRVNLQKAAEIVIHEFRAATLGRITLETPAEFAEWLAAGRLLDAERQVKKDKIETNRLIKFKKIPRPEKNREPDES